MLHPVIGERGRERAAAKLFGRRGVNFGGSRL